jgi:hypothetical protein
VKSKFSGIALVLLFLLSGPKQRLSVVPTKNERPGSGFDVVLVLGKKLCNYAEAWAITVLGIVVNVRNWF